MSGVVNGQLVNQAVTNAAFVGSIAASGSTPLAFDVTLSPSGGIQLIQSGQNITVYAPSAYSGGVTSIAASGSAPIIGAALIAGSGAAVITEAGQAITVYVPNISQTLIGASASVTSYLSGNVQLAASGGTVLKQIGQVITIFSPTSPTYTAATKTSGAYTLLSTDNFIYSNGASAINLTAASAMTIQSYYIMNVHASSAINVNTNGTDLFSSNAATTLSLPFGGASIMVSPRSPSAWSVF